MGKKKKKKTTLPHHYYPESTVYIRVHSLCCAFAVRLDKCILACIHHYSIIQSSFIVLKILCAPPSHPSIPLPPLTTRCHHWNHPVQIYLRDNVGSVPEHHSKANHRNCLVSQ